MHYLVCGGGPHLSGNLMQSYIQTCTILYVWGVWGPHLSENLMQFHTFLIIYTLLLYDLYLTIFSWHDCMTFLPEEVENEILHVQCLFIYSRYAK